MPMKRRPPSPSRKPQAPSPSASTPGAKKPNATSMITFLGVGSSESGQRYIKVAVRKKMALLNVDNLSGQHPAELKILTSLGAPLIASSARTDFLNQAQIEAQREPTFTVVTRTGWCGEIFVLPKGMVSQEQANVERYFDPRYGQYHRKLHPAGTVKGWQKLARLCRGKTRLIAALCLALTGPVCVAFGMEPPGIALVGRGGLGKTTIGRVTGTVIGGDRSVHRVLGCGVAGNNTDLNLEIVAAAFDQMFLFLNDLHKAKKESVEAVIELMNGEGRGRFTEMERLQFCTPLLITSNTSFGDSGAI
jgi:hypothetical protein